MSWPSCVGAWLWVAAQCVYHKAMAAYYAWAVDDLERQGRHSSATWQEAFWSRVEHDNKIRSLKRR